MGIESSVSDKERMREIIHKQEERWSQSNKEAGTPVPLKELPPSPALSPSWKYARQLGSSWEFWGVFRSFLSCRVRWPGRGEPWPVLGDSSWVPTWSLQRSGASVLELVILMCLAVFIAVKLSAISCSLLWSSLHQLHVSKTNRFLNQLSSQLSKTNACSPNTRGFFLPEVKTTESKQNPGSRETRNFICVFLRDSVNPVFSWKEDRKLSCPLSLLKSSSKNLF